ncbi:hypothetical protein AMS68_003148 [Peltaster fructicola]|uniref:LNS2/PITP domain-containing protein n=1 Tax=Peltaster fructicola TaxID=286661 RepID=A0A6H0XSJ6_9PEZI|nr:hypothetical protein AMS68_003148 [Peltaster fructicola]
MQYVRSISGSVSTAWNSINPATLSGAIDVIVVEQEDGSLACSPFHIRFGKFSLLRPSDKKVEFAVNGKKQEYPMKLGEGGEAFFVFETQESVPEALQTSPLPRRRYRPQLWLRKEQTAHEKHDGGHAHHVKQSKKRECDIPAAKAALDQSHLLPLDPPSPASSKSHERPSSPPPGTKEEAVTRAINLSKKLWTSNIPTQVTDSGDLMLDMTGYKSDTSEALQAEGIARKLLSEEFDGPHNIGGLIGADEHGNLWIYSSEEAKAAASRKATAHPLGALQQSGFASTDAISDPGYHSDDNRSETSDLNLMAKHIRHDSDSAVGLTTQPSSPTTIAATGDPNRNYAKTLRLTSDQLKAMDLMPGGNTMAFTVNRATCAATLWYWKHDVPIVISDIDGTITKSDVLGHVLNSIGRDWTHLGVAKLYTEIAANGYNFLYLTSRSVGQADTTRTYLDGVVQDGFKLPRGPVILSPDRTIAALRREIYLRKPEIFKMACLRDIMALFAGHGGVDDTHASVEAGLHTSPAVMEQLNVGKGKGGSPFYAGFGNRLTDALSYRSVNIPSTRIFTINSNSEVSLDLLSLNKYKTGYSSMREIVDHYFPPVGLRLLKGGGEDFTDFNYWRSKPLDIVDFTDSEDDDDDDNHALFSSRNNARSPDPNRGAVFSEDEGDDMVDSYLSEQRRSINGIIDGGDSELDDEDSIVEDDEDEDVEQDEFELEVNRSQTPEDVVQKRLDELLGSTPRNYGGGLTGNWGD